MAPFSLLRRILSTVIPKEASGYQEYLRSCSTKKSRFTGQIDLAGKFNFPYTQWQGYFSKRGYLEFQKSKLKCQPSLALICKKATILSKPVSMFDKI